MGRYFFDTRDGDAFFRDETGEEHPDLNSVKVEAGRFLTDVGRDVIPGSERRVLTVQVRDEQHPVLEAWLTFEAVLLP